MEENFLQGDEEKLLGLPVQALNDREKANLPHSQIGFIEYLVAPFLLVVIKARGEESTRGWRREKHRVGSCLKEKALGLTSLGGICIWAIIRAD